MSDALVGLVGVAVGGIVTGGVQSYSSWAQRRLAARSAARLVRIALLSAQAEITTVITYGRWNTTAEDWFSYGEEWAERQRYLADVLSANDFEQVALTFVLIETAARARRAVLTDPPPEGSSGWTFDPEPARLAVAGCQIVLPTLAAASRTWRERRRAEPDPAL